MKTAPILVAGLLALTLVPASAEAGHRPLWQCDDPPDKVVQYLVANAVPILLEILGEYMFALGKTKCTALETLGICQDETMPFTPGQPLTTGSLHPHRGLCYEYPFVPGAGARACPAGQKIEHRTSFDFHVHTCVAMTKPWV